MADRSEFTAGHVPHAGLTSADAETLLSSVCLTNTEIQAHVTLCSCSYFSRFSAPARILICLMICWFKLARLFCSLLRPVWANGLQPWDQEEEERVSETHFNQETFTLKMIITALCTVWTSAWQQPLNKYVSSVIYTSIKLTIVYFPLGSFIHCLHCCGDRAVDALFNSVRSHPQHATNKHSDDWSRCKTNQRRQKPLSARWNLFWCLALFWQSSIWSQNDPKHVREVLRILNSINLCIWCRHVMFLGFSFPFSPPRSTLCCCRTTLKVTCDTFQHASHDLSNKICQRTKTYKFHQLNQCKYVILHTYTGAHTHTKKVSFIVDTVGPGKWRSGISSWQHS